MSENATEHREEKGAKVIPLVPREKCTTEENEGQDSQERLERLLEDSRRRAEGRLGELWNQ